MIGLLCGVPLGIALGRALWRTVAGFTPLAYHPPVALVTLLLIGPAALLAANMLAAWPQRRAARLHAGQILRSDSPAAPRVAPSIRRPRAGWHRRPRRATLRTPDRRSTFVR